MEQYTKIYEIFSISHILIYLAIINLIAFLAMYLDKKKAKKGKWRISEATLIGIVLLGGGIGGIVGMYKFRHKTKKPRFYIGFPVILILETIALIYVIIHFHLVF